MFINIHGFGGQGENTKYLWLRKTYPEEEIFCPTFDYTTAHPEEVLSRYEAEVRAQVKAGRSVRIVGTSWGGFFAYCLNALFPNLPTVLVNPSLNPYLSRRYAELNHDLLLEYVGVLGRHMLRHSDASCAVIIGSRDEVIPHEVVTIPIFAPESVHRFDVQHNFDMDAEPELPRLMMEHFKRTFA